MDKGTITELIVIGIAVLIGVALFPAIQKVCYDLLYPVNSSGAVITSNVSTLGAVFLTLIPFAYILVVFAVAIAVVISVLGKK